jgi:hypothetical protein
MEKEDVEVYGLAVAAVRTKSSVLWIWEDTVFPLIQLICTLPETGAENCNLFWCKHIPQTHSTRFCMTYISNADLLQTDNFMQTYSAYE